jgi:hypothetical protein
MDLIKFLNRKDCLDYIEKKLKELDELKRSN